MYNYCNLAFAVSVFIFIAIPAVTSIQCYNCRSEDSPDCMLDEPAARFLTNCSTLKEGPKYVACRKIDNFVDFEVLGQKPTRRVIRQCAADVDRERPCYYRAGFGGRANVCDCFENKCNFALSIKSSFITISVISLIAFLL